MPDGGVDPKAGELMPPYYLHLRKVTVLRYIAGLRKDRVNPVSLDQMKQRFCSILVSPQDVADMVDRCVQSGYVRMCRQGQSYVYEITERGTKALFRMENPNT